jgi:hypothetical protein
MWSKESKLLLLEKCRLVPVVRNYISHRSISRTIKSGSSTQPDRSGKWYKLWILCDYSVCGLVRSILIAQTKVVRTLQSSSAKIRNPLKPFERVKVSPLDATILRH